MRIIQIEDFFHPDAGYQINILSKFMAKEGHEVIIITSEIDKIPEYLTSFFGKEDIINRDKIYSDSYNVRIIRLPILAYKSGRVIFSREIFKVVEDLDPDILFIHGNDTLTAIRYLLKLKSVKYPLIMDSHMVEMASVNKFSKLFRFLYRKFITPKIVKEKIPVIRTQNDNYVQKHLGIPLELSPWISVGSDTLLFQPNNAVKKMFRQKYNIKEDDFVVIYTGKLDESKGGLLLAETFKNKFETRKNVVLLVVGNSVGDYGEIVEKKFQQSENRIIRFPTQRYTDLAMFYQSADLSVFPKQCSLSFYDAQACGLPVVSEDNPINVDRLKYNNGFNFKTDSVADFREKISMCANMEENEYQSIKRNAYNFVRKYYDYSDITNEYLEIINKKYTDYKLSKKFNDNGKLL
jgi:glycosyltransferase involved in cell wall biosynthesis